LKEITGAYIDKIDRNKHVAEKKEDDSVIPIIPPIIPNRADNQPGTIIP
jgi:hypothetical protein